MASVAHIDKVLIDRTLEKQGYALVGKHSAVKICTWTKKSITGKDTCYKETFYGIRAHRCCQMTPSINYCSNACTFCWRNTEWTFGSDITDGDDPDSIIDGCIAAQRKLLSGYGGNPKADRTKLEEAREPMHFAISLSGEPTSYRRLSEIIRLLHGRGRTTFVVTNGQNPDALATLEPPTQIYLSFSAPDEDLFRAIVNPSFPDGWERLMRSADILKGMRERTRTAVRITCIRGMNMAHPEKWAALLERAHPLFAEVKAYMFVGGSRERLSMANMPLHDEVKAFAAEIAENCAYRIIDEKKESRVVLMMEQDMPDRMMRFED
ncbi:4-demethylwyosine synthase TYW1 [Candidatus Woesearchaeota archaeon]|nr:4-demethylwyosine synthase TYW1 [Candidatus Woesearchaeota archaeon]